MVMGDGPQGIVPKEFRFVMRQEGTIENQIDMPMGTLRDLCLCD